MTEPKILFIGPLKDFSGYATVARNYVRALSLAGCDLVTRSLNYDGASRETDEFENSLESKSVAGAEIVLQHTTPSEMERFPGKFNVGLFCWETDRVPQEWVNELNGMDLVIVPCKINAMAARKSGVVVPVEVVPYAFDPAKYENVKPAPYPKDEDTFNILAIFQYAKKKGLDPLLKAYFSEFTAEDKVLLNIKTYLGPRDTPEHTQQLKGIIRSIRDAHRLQYYAPVNLIHSIMDEDEVAALYQTSDLYCLPSRGEGWGVPHFDALGYGLPAVATRGTAPEEFIHPSCGWLVDAHPSPCVDMPHPYPYLYTAKDMWMEPHVDSLMKILRQAYDLWKYNKQAWKDMQDAARLTPELYALDIVGRDLKDVIMNYYQMWKFSGEENVN